MSFENLRVYRATERLIAMLDELFAKAPPGFARDIAHGRNAASSILFNIAEAVGSHGSGKKTNHFGIARGSADEVRAVLRRLCLGRAFTEKQVAPPSILARTIAKMLTSLIAKVADT
jgi:four helix bundle protein